MTTNGIDSTCDRDDLPPRARHLLHQDRHQGGRDRGCLLRAGTGRRAAGGRRPARSRARGGLAHDPFHRGAATRMNTRPIGVFDSGIGGLTVVRALTRRLPHENIVYFGDTARVPLRPEVAGSGSRIRGPRRGGADGPQRQGRGGRLQHRVRRGAGRLCRNSPASR
ncbi:MAG: hypothetical protein MZV64_29520 [Ignavibacteriales bacterium]|nr:hypothetical protein [Ignavibacteriales bacterium]